MYLSFTRLLINAFLIPYKLSNYQYLMNMSSPSKGTILITQLKC